MNHARHNSDDIPIEWLAAYVDGELDSCAASRVETWLARHPEALEELRIQEGLSGTNAEFRNAVQVPMPDDAVFADVLANIEAELAIEDPKPTVRAKRWPWVIVGGTAAAAVLLIAWLQFTPPTEKPNQAPQAKLVEPMRETEPVIEFASADDVEIVSMFDRDAPMLVIGSHPMTKVPNWASSEDVVLEWVEPDHQGWFPEMGNTPSPTPSPMVLMPSTRGR